MCKVCDDIYNAISATFEPIDDQTLEEVISGVFNKEFTVNAPPFKLFLNTGKSLSDAIRYAFEFDKIAAVEATPKFKLAADLQKNVYRFSAAKTYQQTKALNALLVDDKGIAKTFYQFKKDASGVLKSFNTTYLAAEHQRSVAASQNAIYWDEIQRDKDYFPLLKYETVGDARVRPTHVALDNIVRPVDDVFWSNYMPPNGWNCRCTVIQLEAGDAPQTDLSNFKKPEDVLEEFMYNPGQQRIVFTDAHPYFRIDPRDTGLAMQNFNLPMPKTFPTPELIEPPKK